MTAKEKRELAVKYMKSRLKKNTYTNGDLRKYFFGYPDNKVGNTSQKGYSDCSAACAAAIKAAAGISIGGNTDAQIKNRAKGMIVDQTTGIYPDESKLLPGDCLYFKGNVYHAMDVGHVEMYTGKNECTGHGSGTGPNVHNLKEYCKNRGSATKRYFMAIRWILDDDDGSVRTLKRGSFGADVTKMQSMLLTLGYDLGKWGADGDFGSDTETALKAFQTAQGMTVNGICDDAVWAKLEALVAADGDEDDVTAPPEAVKPEGNLTVRAGTWNLRTGPGTEYDIAASVNGGQTLDEVTTDWIPVKVGGRILWVSPKAIQP